MPLNLQIPRPSTLVLCGLVLALLVSTPVPLAILVTVVVWAFHTPAALVAGIVAVLGWRVMHPKAVR
jgi:hypothetical protein